MAETTSYLTLPVLPLKNGVVFPHMVVTLQVESDEGKAALDAAEQSGGQLLLVPRIDDDYAGYGTVARIQGVESGDVRTVLVQGLARARIGSGLTGANGALWVEAAQLPEADIYDSRVDDLVDAYRSIVARLLRLRGMGGIADRVLSMDDAGQLADLAVYSPDLTLEQKVELLETPNVADRLEQLIEWMTDILTDAEVRKQVEDDTADRIEKGQREYVLRQQMAAIKAELGEDAEVVDEYRELLAKTPLPQNVFNAVEKEVDRLERMSEQSPEHSWIRTWLDTVFDLPWGKTTDDNLDLGAARSVLDSDHTGLDDVKERIVEHLAVRKLRLERALDDDGESRNQEAAILLLVGPPGVGKTSLGESVARALGRSFVRVALGGVRDEAEIRGHRRTYVGARPGRIARALQEAGSLNPVFLLDEMDKVGADWRGDPSSALLEVLDPAQNHTFRDHYLEFDLDLSDVLFIATANILDTIPAPLLDRTEVIRLDGYTDNEKVVIAREHLLPRRKKAAGLRDGELTIDDDALLQIVDGYTREAGVRNLERQLGKLVRKVVTRIATEEAESMHVDVGDIKDLLGKQKVHRDEAKGRTGVPGVATGLAVTGMGGDVLFIEATRMEGEQGLTLTGQLGDVMKESAQIALSYVKAHAPEVDPIKLNQRFHVHVPAGAVPKDGPSAGITMTTALVSLLTDRKVKENVGMTGEVTLSGKVLPIGGVKQKVLAAHRAGLDTVILPARNEDDLDDVPDEVRSAMTFLMADDIGQVLEWALG